MSLQLWAQGQVGKEWGRHMCTHACVCVCVCVYLFIFLDFMILPYHAFSPYHVPLFNGFTLDCISKGVKHLSPPNILLKESSSSLRTPARQRSVSSSVSARVPDSTLFSARSYRNCSVLPPWMDSSPGFLREPGWPVFRYCLLPGTSCHLPISYLVGTEASWSVPEFITGILCIGF